jgi:hypothetical protein
MRILIVIPIMLLASSAAAQDAVEAAGSCVVIHENSEADGEKMVTCFENISLERTSFESGVCQWKTEAQAARNVQTTTQFVPYCPASYAAFCDLLVLGNGIVAPVKIFLYDRSEDVLERARKQCLSGGGKWHPNDEESE